MKNWKLNLNQLVIDHWCDAGNYEEVLAWIDAVNMEQGEVHPYFYELYDPSNTQNTTRTLTSIAKDINGFSIKSWESEPFAKRSLVKALQMFIDERKSVQEICVLINKLDMLYNIELSGVENQNKDTNDGEWWLGDLWNCCDWCDETWSYSNSSHLIIEAKRVIEKCG